MKRSWLGVGLLAIMLVIGLLVTRAMGRIHDPIARDLTAAGEYALAGNWNQAEALSQQASDSWEKHALFRACFADHNPVEEIDAAFAMLRVYGTAREEQAFAGGCSDLAKKVAAVGEAHAFVWWNLL